MSSNKQVAVTNPFSNAVSAATPGGGNVATSAAGADAQRAIAEVQAAILLAKQFPRDKMQAMDEILNDCARETLAASAMYSFARGGSEITGPSIRLAESIAMSWGNIQFGWDEKTRNGASSEIVAWAWDVEKNIRRSTTFHVKHWRDTRQGGYQLKDERDIYELCANQAARRLRGCILNLIPGDVIEAAVKQCEVTLATSIEITPERIKKMVAEFGKYGVSKEMLEKRVQRRIDTVTGAQMMTLIKIYNSLKDGMSVAGDWFAVEQEEAPKKGNAGAKEALKSKDADKPAEQEDKPVEPKGKDKEQGSKVEDGEGEESEETPPIFGVDDYDLTDSESLKEASKALIAFLRSYDEAERQDVFTDVDGISVTDALDKAGFAKEKKHYEALGITI